MKQGYDVIIDSRAVIKRPELITMGNHISIDCFTYISTRVTMGNWVHIAPFVSIIGGAVGNFTMGNYTALAAGARIICATDEGGDAMICSFLPMEYKNVKAKPIIMEDFTGLRTNAIILPGVTMARGSILEINSILDQDTVEWGIYLGTPARLVGYRDKNKLIKMIDNMEHDETLI